jgi:hypothetical protein
MKSNQRDAYSDSWRRRSCWQWLMRLLKARPDRFPEVFGSSAEGNPDNGR